MRAEPGRTLTGGPSFADPFRGILRASKGGKSRGPRSGRRCGRYRSFESRSSRLGRFRLPTTPADSGKDREIPNHRAASPDCHFDRRVRSARREFERGSDEARQFDSERWRASPALQDRWLCSARRGWGLGRVKPANSINCKTAGLTRRLENGRVRSARKPTAIQGAGRVATLVR